MDPIQNPKTTSTVEITPVTNAVTVANKPTKGQKNVESVIIKKVTHTHTREGVKGVVIHTSKCKNMRTLEGFPVERFKFTEKQWHNFVVASGKPSIIFEKQIIGGVYHLETQWVVAGEPFLRGEGTYTKDHPARVIETINMSQAAVADDTKAATAAYYAYEFGSKPASQEVNVASASIVDEVDLGEEMAA